MNRVQKLVNFCARVVSGRRRYDHISDVMKNLQWMSANDLTQYHRLCMLHSVLTAKLPRALYETIGETGEQRHEYDTRRAGAITLPQIRNEAGRRRVNYSAVSAYNNLPFTPRVTTFRRQLKKHLS